MGDYTRVNLKEVEDQALKFGLSPALESRFAREALNLKDAGLSYFRIAPGHRVPFGHRHEIQEEVYVVLSGSLRIRVDEEVLDLGPWDAVRMAPETMRGVEAGPEGTELLAFSACNSSNGDVVVQPGWWGDEAGPANP